ncbi:unnamed protein product [Calypogeia fissa]
MALDNPITDSQARMDGAGTSEQRPPPAARPPPSVPLPRYDGAVDAWLDGLNMQNLIPGNTPIRSQVHTIGGDEHDAIGPTVGRDEGEDTSGIETAPPPNPLPVRTRGLECILVDMGESHVTRSGADDIPHGKKLWTADEMHEAVANNLVHAKDNPPPRSPSQCSSSTHGQSCPSLLKRENEFANGECIDQMHIREKIVSYLGDCQYRMTRKVRESRTSNGDYAKPVGMPQEAFDAIVTELNVAPDTHSLCRISRMVAANRARVARVRPTTNYWGQGGYKAFLDTYVSLLPPPLSRCLSLIVGACLRKFFALVTPGFFMFYVVNDVSVLCFTS